jgi:outer membrane autotransporter protein
MCLAVRKSSVLIRAVILILLGTLEVAQGENVLEANGPGQHLTSIDKIYSTSTAQPAMLAIDGGTIRSTSDQVAVLPPAGVTALQAQGIGSLITAENPSILALGLGETGISGAKAVDGGLVSLDGGKIEITGDSSFGLYGDGGTVTAKGTLTISMTGVDSHGAEALGTGLVEIDPGTTITTEGSGGIGIFALTRGTVSANGVVITTSGILSLLSGFSADGAAALGGTITLENSSITTSGVNAKGLHVLNANSTIFGTNLTLTTSGVAASGAEADNGGLIELNGGTITTHGDEAFGLFGTDNGKVTAGGMTISTAGADAYGAFAQTGGTLTLNPGIVIQTSGKGSYGLYALNGGSITGNGVNVTTSGGLGVLLNTADGAAALTGPMGPGTITLQNSTITANGVGANGLSVSGAGSSITVTNSNIVSSQGDGASVSNSANLTLSGSSFTALIHGIVATGGTAGAPNSITVSGGSLTTVLGDAFQVQNGATNITVSNGATVTGNSSLLRVLDPPPETVVNFTASHASLFGDIFADSASQTTVTLTDSTILTGKVNPPPLGAGVDMTIDGSSQWVMTGSSNVKSLSVSPGASAVFSAPFAEAYHTLTIGSLSGTGGIFGMNIDLRGTHGDLIDITGTSDGSHLLTFTDRGHGTDLRPNQALLVVETPDGVAGFSGMTDRAVFKYYVVHGNGSSATPNPDDWYLVRADKIVRDQVTRSANQAPGSIDTPVGLSTVDALSNAANAAIGTFAAGVPLFYADMDTLLQRLGELRLLAGESRASVDSSGKAILPSMPPEETPLTIGTWVTGFGNGMHINDQASRAFDQNTGGFQLGADKRFAAFNGDLYVGGFLSYFNASRDFLDGGNGSTNALSVGAYTTWLNPKGWYADLVLKYTQLWNYFNTPASDGSISTGNYSIPALGGSLEVGKRFDVGRFFIEPQTQLAGVWEAGNSYSASNGLMVDGSDQYSLQGRLGLRAGMHIAFANGIEIEPYLKVSAVHEFLTGDQITLDETGFNPTLSGTWVDAAAGITARLSQSVFLYGEYDYANGDKIREPWAVNAGVRWRWGGRSEAATTVPPPSEKEFTGKEQEPKAVEQPSVKTTEPWQITVGGPGWLAGVSGYTGFHGVNPYVNVGLGQILRHVNVIDTLGAEVRNGRFGVFGDYLLLNGQAGTGESSGLVSKVDVGLQQFIGEFFGSYRVIEGPRGWLDLLAGFRFTYLGQQVGLQANNMAIDAASTELVEAFAQSLTTPGSNLQNLVRQQIVDKLTSLNGNNPALPVGPIAAGQRGKIAELVQQVVASQDPELVAAIRTGAQARVNQLKTQIASQVANTLTSQLNRSFSFYDSWIDPVIGLRGRFNLSKAFYLTAESDVGGFGIGSDIAVQAYAALGCQITRNIYSEVGYRYLYDDFRDESANDFLYQLSLHGAQITVGLRF